MRKAIRQVVSYQMTWSSLSSNIQFICFFSCRKNLILSDCVCEQQICSADYVPSTIIDELSKQPPIHQITTRYLQQAMIPGNHVKAIYLCNRFAYETAYKGALAVESYSMTLDDHKGSQ